MPNGSESSFTTPTSNSTLLRVVQQRLGHSGLGLSQYEPSWSACTKEQVFMKVENVRDHWRWHQGRKQLARNRGNSHFRNSLQ
eukprot:4801849-Amphidinium_carterae.1